MKYNKILHCYIQCEVDDFYNLFTILPDFIQKNNVNSVKFWVDSIYFHDDQFKKQRGFIIDLMCKFGDYTIIPKECGSFKQSYNNFDYDNIKNIFMFYRNPLTQSYMRSRIKYGDLFIYSTNNFIYQWKDSYNILL